jgi:glycosyltransferase involved in cell wall biosynthesis
MNSKVPKVTVLLATYNGVRFLNEQLTSLNEQRHVQVEVLVNDDGSTDGTIELLQKWRDKGLVVSISESMGLGSTRAFLKLLQECNQKPYVAFCDQDDVWDPSKLASQIALCEESIPSLVFSRRSYCDGSGKIVGISPELGKAPSFGNALVENIAHGNTVLLNGPSIKLINSYVLPDIAHYDSWIYLLISALGRCKYIVEPLVQYRIHGDNQVGLRKYIQNRFETSARNFVYQAACLPEEIIQTLSEKDRLMLAKFTLVLRVKSKRQKVKAIMNAKFDRQRLLDRIGFTIILLLLVKKEKI